MGFRECPQEVLKSSIILTQRRIFFCKTLSFLFKENLVPDQVSGGRRQMFSGDEVWSPCCRDRKEGSIFEDVSSNSLKHRYSLLFTCQPGCIIYWRYFPYRVNFLPEITVTREINWLFLVSSRSWLLQPLIGFSCRGVYRDHKIILLLSRWPCYCRWYHIHSRLWTYLVKCSVWAHS